MGIFHDMVEVVVRTPWPLTVRFDGQETTLNPGKNLIPRLTLTHAMNQNPIMGTADPDNPSITGAEYLIGVTEKAHKYPCEPLTKDELDTLKNKPSRFNYEELMAPTMGKKDKIVLRGRKTVSQFEAKEAGSLLSTDRND
jgi:hypothetical protein